MTTPSTLLTPDQITRLSELIESMRETLEACELICENGYKDVSCQDLELEMGSLESCIGKMASKVELMYQYRDISRDDVSYAKTHHSTRPMVRKLSLVVNNP